MVLRRKFALTALAVKRATEPGYYSDGGGLTLQVLPSGSKSWIYRFMIDRRAREMGLGSVATFSLAEARERARAARQLVADGIDPIEERKQSRRERQERAAMQITFAEAAERYIDAHQASWRNAKHAYQWRATIGHHANPMFGEKPVGDVTQADVMRALTPIWTKKNETAARLQGRIENILDWCRVQGFFTGDNPARWRGYLEKLLPKPAAVRIAHHPSLPWREVPTFMEALRVRPGASARCLEWIALTATRSGEARGARWSEIDLTGRVWHIPGERMKASRPHDVPLTDAMLRILEIMRAESAGELVFPGRGDDGLSDMSVLAVVRRMNAPEPVWRDQDGRPMHVHGLRASFRIWAAEATNYPRQVAEYALAHQLPDRVEAAYQRSTLFEQRRAMMADWSAFCTSKPKAADVVPIRGVA